MTTLRRLFLTALFPGLIFPTVLQANEESTKAEPVPAVSATQPPAAPAGKQPPSSPASVESARKPAKPPSMIDYCREHTC
jgi:hypothetical protein